MTMFKQQIGATQNEIESCIDQLNSRICETVAAMKHDIFNLYSIPSSEDEETLEVWNKTLSILLKTRANLVSANEALEGVSV